MKNHLAMAAFVIFGASALAAPVQAQEISPTLKKMLGGLPIADMKDEVQKMVGTLKKTSCGGGLTGCYATKSGPLQLYFFTSGAAQQTFLLVLNKSMALPPLLKPNVQKVLGGTQVSDPIISISTTDYDLDIAKMPADLQKIVKDSYFNVDVLSFSSGVQLAARANLGGAIKTTLSLMGVKADQMTMRAAVVMPIPTDLAGGAGSGAGLADAMKHGDTMKKAGADSLIPEAFVEFQLAPGSTVALNSPRLILTDTTFFINNVLTFGYKGNAHYEGTSKNFILQFQTPLDPAGAMDLLDFSFRMAMPATFTLDDFAHVAASMVMSDTMAASAAATSLKKYGGGYIRQIKSIATPLLALAKPLSVFQVANPHPAAPYKFGDRSKPFPTTDAAFNVYLLGPLADGGPKMHVAGDMRILGQNMKKMETTVGPTGYHAMTEDSITVKLGPLGKTSVKMKTNVDITSKEQSIKLVGDLAGQKLSLELGPEILKIYMNASCVNPFEINATVAIQESMNIATILDAQGGANVDPSKIQGCVGRDLEAAYRKVAGQYSSLSGYSAKEANAALNKIAADYDKAKKAARDVANVSSNAAVNAMNDAGNAFRGLGKKKKHRKGPDPRFAASVFDWDFYYDHYDDLVKAKVDLASHWRDHGLAEGRRASPEFSAKYYRARYLDVQEKCGVKDYQCAMQHWLDEGIEEGRQGSPDVSVAAYLKRYPSLQQTVGKEGYFDAMEDWLNDGTDNKRNARPESDEDGPIYGPQLIGGDGGAPWTDIDKCTGQHVTGFRLWYGKEVNTVQFKYGANGYADAHGYDSRGKFMEDVTLKANEYIVRVDYRAGSHVDALTFISNLGTKYGPYGGGGGDAGTFKVTQGEKLGCIAGREGSTIDRLVFSSTGLR